MSLKFSVCIPAYNRANVLPELLESILSQDFTDYEVVICEDNSPERESISRIVARYDEANPDIIRYFENQETLGYDGNFRTLIEKAKGEYCFFMGNDDLMCPNALSTVAKALSRYENIGVVLRSYASFVDSPGNIDQEFRYFDSERFFAAGPETIASIFRRFVVISGLVLHRETAHRHATERFDGTLLYQLHLVANILTRMNGVFLPEIIVLWRKGGIPDFGHSEKEKGKFVPREQTADSSIHFMKGMLDIAEYAEKTSGQKVYRPILVDIANYSYPILAIQADKGTSIFIRYVFQLAKLGFWRGKMFFIYIFLILLLGTKRVDWLISFIKKRLGYTPTIGKVYRGESI